MGDRRLEPLVLSEAERRTLENWAKRRKTAQGLALRARIVLACADGGLNVAVAARLGVSRATARKWRDRFLARRLDGLGDEPRPGVPRTITDAQVEEVVGRTLEETRRRGHALVQAGAGQADGDLSDIRAPDLAGVRASAPGAPRTSRSLRNPLLIDKIRDVIGLYLAPPGTRRSLRSMRSRRSRCWSEPRRCSR
jgi:transposase-like protein